MRRALRTLLFEVIDYAGLFPPAKLPLTESVENYLRYLHGPERWILGRLVCTTGKLPDLARELAEHPEEPFVPVSVIGQASTNRKEWEHALDHDAKAMNRFLDESEGHAEIQTFEMKVPDLEHLESYIVDLRGFSDTDVFVELPWSPAMDESLGLLAETDWLKAKARTGGLEASAFPTPEQLAGFLQQCAHLDLEFKLTAGLHHPLPRLDNDTGGNMHGFLNVLVALAMLHGHDLSRKEVTDILAEKGAEAFTFADDGLRYRDLQASMDDVEAVREVFVSFGSCSIDEPLGDLREMSLLEEAVGR